ncbi:hypothetical protein GGI25_003106 [Coemansia spiralis]|uniref:Eukaryotic translation initiation factor 2D n=2 Tax=Coemansia TaxID=4863 RepID=A0A9W8KXY1_9FUNG|nr:hypothetical protein EDC05_001461 [Coemansia umbellata]KAJ2624351.1 hypothetical protein GGI26_001485 [Coemansia sp. RSA 1358]KAJ2677586.1 hypothetical protein GGI25_003106 [Coemansia spiralis]
MARESRELFPEAWKHIELSTEDSGNANDSGEAGEVDEDKAANETSILTLASPVPGKLQVAKFVSHIGDKGEIFYSEAGDPLWLRVAASDSESTMLVPTVYTQWQFPALLPVLFTWPTVINKLVGGADLMVPGLVVPEGGLPNLKRGALVAICCPGNLAAQAVGVLTFDTRNIQSVSGAKGKAVLITHTYKDYLWEAGSKLELPIIVPEDEQAAEVTRRDVLSSSNANEDEQQIKGGGSANTEEHVLTAYTDDAAGDEKSSSIAPSEMDELLFRALKQVMATILDPENASPLLPIIASIVYSNYMVPNSPPEKEVDIKKSTYKKLAKFLKAAEKHGLIKLKDIRGETYIKSFNWSHQCLANYKPYRVSSAKKDSKNGSAQSNINSTTNAEDEQKQKPKQQKDNTSSSNSIDIVQLLKPTHALAPLFDDVGAQTETGYFTRQQARSVLEDYIKSHGLVASSNPQFVKLDHRLCDGLLKKEEYSKLVEFKRDKLHARLQETMTLYTQVLIPGKESKLRIGNPSSVDIVCERKAGNKVVTRVIGLEAYGIDPAAIAKELRTLCASSTTVDPVPGKKNAQSVLVQGHQVSAITRLLESKYKLPQRLLTTLDKTGKAKKSQ